jgi:hypothetical protein
MLAILYDENEQKVNRTCALNEQNATLFFVL